MRWQHLSTLLALSAWVLVSLPSSHGQASPWNPLTSLIGGSYPITVAPTPDTTLASGHPAWVSVGGLKCYPCLANDATRCLAPFTFPDPNPDTPLGWPNTPDEFFYWSGTSVGTVNVDGVARTITAEAALEGAYLTGFPDKASRIVFARFRFIAKPPLPGGRKWQLDLPWGKYVHDSDGLKDFHTQDRLIVPAPADAYQPELLPMLLPDHTDKDVFPDGSLVPAIDTEGYLTGPATTVNCRFSDPTITRPCQYKFSEIINGVPVQLGQPWTKTTLTAKVDPLPMTGSCPGGPCNFGPTVLNAATPTQVITITNIGTQNQVLKYLDMGVVGTDATSFFIVSTTKPAAGTQLLGGQTIQVSVYCLPSAYPKGVPPPDGAKVTLSAAVRWLFNERAAFEVPVTCDLGAPSSAASTTTSTTTTTTTTTTDNTLVASPSPPPPPQVPAYMVAVTLKNTAVYPMVETFTVDPTYVYDSNAVPMASPPVPAPAFVMGNVAPDSPAMLTFTPPVAKTTPGQYSVTGKAAWEAAGGSQGFTMSFTAPDGTKATTSTVAVMKDTLSIIKFVSGKWDMKWTSKAARELGPRVPTITVKHEVYYMGNCTALNTPTPFPVDGTLQQKIWHLNSKCANRVNGYAFPGKLLFNFDCGGAGFTVGAGDCRINQNTALYQESGGASAMTRAGSLKMVVVKSLAGNLIPYQY